MAGRRELTGNQPPVIRVKPPGPESRSWNLRLAACEAPGVRTVDERGQGGILWSEARGCNVLDVDGNLYLDFTSGFGAAGIGHRHPAVVEAVRRQAGELLHGLGDVYAHPSRVRLAERLRDLAPVDDPRVYFAISGSDAVEIALKTARLKTGRPGILAFDPSYHGLTLGSLAASSRPEFRRPFEDHLSPHVERLPFGASEERIASHLAKGGCGAVLVEPIVGREGVLIPPAGWLETLSRLAREHGALLIADEILTGFGRTGSLFAVDREGVRPDLLCCGKALAGGMPLGAVIGRRDAMDAWSTRGEALHTATFLAHPPACAASLACLSVLESEDLIQRSARAEPDLRRRLDGWARRWSAIREVRGRGLLWGIDVQDREQAYAIADAARDRGLLLLAGGPRGRVLQIQPPLSIPRDLLATGLALLEEALDEVLGGDRPREPAPRPEESEAS